MRVARLSDRDLRAVALTAVVACGAALWLSYREMAGAREGFRAAAASHAATIMQVRALEQLRARRELVEDRPRPQPDLVARLEAQLHSAGIDAGSLTQVSSLEPQPVRVGSTAAGQADSPYRRQSTTITLERVRPVDLARFLAGWTEAEPLWVVRSIRLQHDLRRTQPGAGPGRVTEEDLFTIHLTLENIHLAPGPDTAGVAP